MGDAYGSHDNGAAVIPAAIGPAFALIGTRGGLERATSAFRERFGDWIAAWDDNREELYRLIRDECEHATVTLWGPEGSVAAEAECLLGSAGERYLLLSVRRGTGNEPRAGPESLIGPWLDEIPAIVWLKDLEGHYLHVNRAYTQVLGIEPEEIAGRTDTELATSQAVDGPRLNSGGAHSSEPLEFEYTVAAFESRPALAALRFAVRDSSGAPVAVCGVAAPLPDAAVARAECARLMQIERSSRLGDDSIRADVIAEWGLSARREHAPQPEEAEAVASPAYAHPELAGELERVRAELEQVTGELEHAHTRLGELEATLAEERQRLGAELDAARASAADLSGLLAEERRRIESMQHESDAAERRTGELLAELSAERARREEREQALQAFRSRLGELEVTLADSRAQTEGVEEELARAEAERAGAEQILAGERARIAELEGALSAGRERIAELESTLSAGRERIAELESTMVSERERSDAADAARAESAQAAVAAHRADAERAQAALSTQRAAADQEAGALREEVAALRGEVDELEEQVQRERRAAEEVRASLADATARLEAARQETPEAQPAVPREAGGATGRPELGAASDPAPAPAEPVPHGQHPSAAATEGPVPELRWRPAAQHELTATLTGALEWRTGLRHAVRIIGAEGGWDAVTAWLPEARKAVLRCTAMWTRAASGLGPFETLTWQKPQPIAGELGRALGGAHAAWLTGLDAADDLRCASAAREGMRSAMLVPIHYGGKPIGVLELLTRAARVPDAEIAVSLEAVAVQLGHFAHLTRLGSEPRWRTRL